MEVVCKICIAQSWWEHTFTSRARPFASFFTEIVQVPSWFTGVGCPPRHVHAVSYSLCLQQKVNSFIEQQIVLCCKLCVHVLTQLTEWNSKLKGGIHKIKPFEHLLRLLTKTVTCLYTITVYLSKFSFSIRNNFPATEDVFLSKTKDIFIKGFLREQILVWEVLRNGNRKLPVPGS